MTIFVHQSQRRLSQLFLSESLNIKMNDIQCYRRKPTEKLLALWLFLGMPIIATSGPSANVVGIPMGPELKMDPYFIEAQHTTSRNITVYTGQTAFMECRVRNLGAKQVSWVRHTDVHILAVGSHVFTTDTRFSASYFEDAGRFNLAIKRVEKSDEGTYECQISTKPIISFYIHLHVQEPMTKILSEPSLHVEQDSSINLTCIASSMGQHGGKSSQYSENNRILWYKNDKLVDNFVGGRGTITENASKSNIKSNIYVPKASVMDSGNYTCISPSFNINTTVKVHVLVDGESPNAWKTSNLAVASTQLNYSSSITHLILQTSMLLSYLVVCIKILVIL